MAPPATPTSRDVARSLGIAQSTVSRAFTPGAPISEALRQRIHQAADALGYRPNLLARGLIAGRSRLIGVLIAPQTNLLYPELLYELGVRLAADDRQILLCPAQDADAAARAVTRLEAFRVEAVLATGVLAEKDARRLAASVPLVTFNRPIAGIAGVSCDFADAGATLARRLLAKGRRHFALIGGPTGSWVSDAFIGGAVAVLDDCSAASWALISAAYTYAAGRKSVAEVQRRIGESVDAVLCVNDLTAKGCLEGLLATGQNAPEDVAIAAMVRSLDADVTARMEGMQQPIGAMIEKAIDLLTSSRGDTQHVVLRARLAAADKQMLRFP